MTPDVVHHVKSKMVCLKRVITKTVTNPNVVRVKSFSLPLERDSILKRFEECIQGGIVVILCDYRC
jgi:hypothetical protein